jgi:hypothetical protein
MEAYLLYTLADTDFHSCAFAVHCADVASAVDLLGGLGARKGVLAGSAVRTISCCVLIAFFLTHPASCPMKTRATCTSTWTFRTRPRWSAAARQLEEILANTPDVEYTTSVVGFSLLSFVRTTYNGFFFVTLKPWSGRKTREEQFQEIRVRLNQQLSKLPQGTAFSFSPPAIPGVGTSGGFQSCSKTVPGAVLSAFYPAYMVQIETDVCSQIGLVMLIGLAAKSAILIAEFAKMSTKKENHWLMLRSKGRDFVPAPF